MGDGGKGSKARPFSVTQDEYARRWDMIFARDIEPESTEQIRITASGKTEVFREGTWQPTYEVDVDPDYPDNY